MSTFEAPNDYRNYLMHYGVKGMKWRNHRRSQMNPNYRLSSNRKTINDREMRQRHSDQEHEQSARNHQTRVDNINAERHHSAEDSHRRREADRLAAEKHDEEKRRQQEALERHRQHEAEVRANTKGGNQRVGRSTKIAQNLANQLGIMTPGRHQALYYQQQIENRRRRRHGH